MGSIEHHVSQLQAAKESGDLEAYGRLRDELRAKSEDELRAIAERAGIDGVDALSRDQLVERLTEEPGANEA